MLFTKKPIGTVAYMGGVMSVPEQFCFSLAQAVQYSNEYLCQPGQYIHLDRATDSYHSTARNYLSQRFLGDWLLQLDTDHQFEPDLFCRLVAIFNKCDLDVLSGMYRYKAPPNTPTLYTWNPESKNYEFILDIPRENELIEIGCSGAGCLLIRRRVFDKIRKETGHEPFDIDGPFSEDFSFYNRLRQVGIKAYGSTRIESFHLKTVPVMAAPLPPMPPGAMKIVNTTLDELSKAAFLEVKKDILKAHSPMRSGAADCLQESPRSKHGEYDVLKQIQNGQIILPT